MIEWLSGFVVDWLGSWAVGWLGGWVVDVCLICMLEMCYVYADLVRACVPTVLCGSGANSIANGG